MKLMLITVLVIIPFLSGFTQPDTARYIFMGHPRDDDRQHEYLLKTVELIDYSKFDLILLGGDLTWNTSADRSTLEYCDSVFSLGDSSTHLAAGNHDLDNVADLLEFTKKSRYYAFSRNNIVFLVLDTEVSVPDFKGEQLEMIRDVADTIEKSDYLVLIHHRIVWMVGVPDLLYLMDSVAASTKNLSQSDFYTDVYPLLQKVKHKGIQVLCLAGDRTDVNIRYIPEDSITFLASGMRGTVPDEENFAIILTHVIHTGNLGWDFVALSEIDTVRGKPVETGIAYHADCRELIIYPNPSAGKCFLLLKGKQDSKILVEILDNCGNRLLLKTLTGAGIPIEIDVSSLSPGIYLLRVYSNNGTITRKIVRIDP
jgi:hypothetical protein